MYSDNIELKKIIFELERTKVLRELCPQENYWHYQVLDLSKLPKELLGEYYSRGEIRLYWV